MCKQVDAVDLVRIARCAHGNYFVTTGHVTLQLTETELVLLTRTIHAMARRQPVLQTAIDAAVLRDISREFDGWSPSAYSPA